MAFYQQAAPLLENSCRVARCHGTKTVGEGYLLLFEDLDEAGFRGCHRPGPEQTRAGLRWLANFHARFLDREIPGTWEQGGYWHLETRRSEWESMPAGSLKEMAGALDRCLRAARYQTLMHGDPKPPNFTWHASEGAAAVDFQYCGRGCGIRDVALFIDRCVGRGNCARLAASWLEVYFEFLGDAMEQNGQGSHSGALTKEWRALFPVAWSDYCRFALGWGSSKTLDPYSLRQVELAAEHLSHQNADQVGHHPDSR